MRPCNFIKAFGVIVSITINLDVCLAADISCTNFWRDAGSFTNARMAQRFPSNRRPKPDTCESILIQGEIQNGDYEKFAALVAENHPFLSKVHIWSPGGKVEDGLKIGALIRKGLLSTHAPFSGLGGSPKHGSLPILTWSDGETRQYTACAGSDCFCASSCFLIWSGGFLRQGTFLGVHRPSIRSTQFANLHPSQASPLYRTLLGEIASYLTYMEIPQRYIEAMTDTASNEMRWLTDREAELLREMPSITEWKATSCGRITKNEMERLLQLFALPYRNPQQDMEHKSLGLKMQKINVCGDDLMAKARDAIQLP